MGVVSIEVTESFPRVGVRQTYFHGLLRAYSSLFSLSKVLLNSCFWEGVVLDGGSWEGHDV